MQIDFGLLRQEDIGGRFTQGMEAGRTMVRRGVQENALAALVGDPNNKAAMAALAGADPAMAMKFREHQVTTAKTRAEMARKELEANREDIVKGAQLLRQFKPKDQVGWNAWLSASEQLGIDTSNAPKEFNQQYADGMIAAADAFEPAKTTDAPASVREYEYARGHGYKGSYMDFQAQNAAPLVVENKDGTKTIYPRGISAPTGQAQPVRISTPQERDALPPGTPYIAPDGTRRVKGGGSGQASAATFQPVGPYNRH